MNGVSPVLGATIRELTKYLPGFIFQKIEKQNARKEETFATKHYDHQGKPCTLLRVVPPTNKNCFKKGIIS